MSRGRVAFMNVPRNAAEVESVAMTPRAQDRLRLGSRPLCSGVRIPRPSADGIFGLIDKSSEDTGYLA